MSLLKKIGSILAVVGGPIGIVAGIISSLVPQAKQGQVAKVTATVQNDLSVFAGIIAEIDGIGQALGLTGPQKLQAAIPLIGAAVANTALVLNHAVADRALYDKAIAGFAQASVDLENSLSGDGVHTQG